MRLRVVFNSRICCAIKSERVKRRDNEPGRWVATGDECASSQAVEDKRINKVAWRAAVFSMLITAVAKVKVDTWN
jgi:hypothetical protein